MSEARHNPVLAGQTAVITGGASGIGKSIVQRFLEAGASCLAADLNEEALAALKQELAEYGDKLDVVKVDVSNRDDVEGMVDRAVQTFGQMDIIVNNAGIMDNLLPIAEMDDDVWERLMKVNLNSVMYGTRKAVRYFMERGEGGVIINTASLSGLCADQHRRRDAPAQRARHGEGNDGLRRRHPLRHPRGDLRRRGVPGLRPGRLHQRRDPHHRRRLERVLGREAYRSHRLPFPNRHHDGRGPRIWTRPPQSR